MTIPTKDKIQIFAAYWGANIKHPCDRASFKLLGLKTITDLVTENNCQLILKPLSGISDEDAKEICGMYGYECSNWGIFLGVSTLDNMVIKFEFYNHRVKIAMTIHAYDFIRSKGYNIGYGSYSPQDLIDAGIVKYAE